MICLFQEMDKNLSSATQRLHGILNHAPLVVRPQSGPGSTLRGQRVTILKGDMTFFKIRT